MIDEIQCQKALEEWRADSPKVDVWASLPAPPIKSLKLLFLQDVESFPMSLKTLTR